MRGAGGSRGGRASAGRWREEDGKREEGEREREREAHARACPPRWSKWSRWRVSASSCGSCAALTTTCSLASSEVVRSWVLEGEYLPKKARA